MTLPCTTRFLWRVSEAGPRTWHIVDTEEGNTMCGAIGLERHAIPIHHPMDVRRRAQDCRKCFRTMQQRARDGR